MNSGFIITELKLMGPDVPSAVILLKKGLNVISGPSNTGKSYIYQCINYMLGSSVKPKEITPAKPYRRLLMKIETAEDVVYTLESDLKGGDFLVSSGETSTVNLARKHNPNSSETISAFLLGLNNLSDKKVRKNARGVTRALSYRDISRFLMVNEERIITEQSPITSGQYTSATEEKSTFKLILSGSDDSDIIESLSKDEVKYRKGKVELLAELIKSSVDELSAVTDNIEPEVQIARIEDSLKDLKSEHEQLKGTFARLDSERGVLSQELSNLLHNRNYNEEILVRSNILKQQYVSDSRRLNSTIEASYLLFENPTVVEDCPVCEKPLGEKNVEPELSSVIAACALEIKKIGVLVNEANASEILLQNENENFSADISLIQQRIAGIADEIQNGVALRMESIFNEIAELNGIKANLNKAVFLKEKIKAFNDQRNGILGTMESKKADSGFEDLLTSTVEGLSTILKEVLIKSNYPDVSGVSFSETKNDFVISGEDRELAGKGYRAITYACFLIALQELVSLKNYSIGPTVLDSPLVTYRKPDAGNEGITVDLAMDFYRYMSSNEKVPQVIILENEEPPAEILPAINHIVFTQNPNSGRYAFIPYQLV
jgi:hypothetical protein